MSKEEIKKLVVDKAKAYRIFDIGFGGGDQMKLNNQKLLMRKIEL